MKKIMILLLISLAAFQFTKAQTPFSHTASNPTGAVTNTSSDTMNYSLSKGYKLLGIQPVITKVSGTVAGVVRFYASINGTNWATLSDTLALANTATNHGIFSFAAPWRYWRLITTGSGTMAATTAAKIIVGE